MSAAVPAGTTATRRRVRRSSATLPYLGLAAAQLAVFIPVAGYRGLDADEGYYTLAAKLVSHGQAAYTDFWWPQMPLYPYAYGAWLKVFGESWDAARAASVVLATAIGLLIYTYAARRVGPRGALAAVVVYASSHLVLDWFLVAKPYALATLPLLAALVIVDAAPEPVSRRHWMVAGLLAGIAVDARLFFAVGVAILGIYALRGAPAGSRLRTGAAFGAGVLAGVLPAMSMLVAEPGRFLFDNLGYHLHRAPGGRVGSIDQKLEIVAGLLNDDSQFLLLIIGASAAVASAVLLRHRVPPPVALAAALAVASLVPNPAFSQDFAPVVPFLVLATVDFAGDLRGLAASRAEPRLVSVLAAAALVGVTLYAASAAINFSRDLDLYGDISLIGDTSTRQGVARLADAIDARTAPGERVLSLWPAPLLESSAEQVPGFENDYAPRGVETAGISPVEVAEYRMGTTAKIGALISRREVRVIVFSPLGIYAIDRHTGAPPRDWEATIRASGYRRAAQIGLNVLYVRGARP